LLLNSFSNLIEKLFERIYIVTDRLRQTFLFFRESWLKNRVNQES
jgi:hypothetical protein